MHGRTEFLIAAAMVAALWTPASMAQKDAAEKAREGSIEHWIEYYQAERRKPPVPSGEQPSGESAAVKPRKPEVPTPKKAGQK